MRRSETDELRSLREGKWFFDFSRAEETLYIHVFEINMVAKFSNKGKNENVSETIQKKVAQGAE